jgi:hypothetical protein
MRLSEGEGSDDLEIGSSGDLKVKGIGWECPTHIGTGPFLPPLRDFAMPTNLPTAYAVGCILAPLRGYGLSQDQSQRRRVRAPAAHNRPTQTPLIPEAYGRSTWRA